MEDKLIRATALDGKVRAFAARTTQLVEQLRQRHHTLPVATAALGRTLTAGAMMGAMLKGEEKLTIQVKGNGPLGQIVVDANARCEVRGYVENPLVELPLNTAGKLDVKGAVGTEGFIYVLKDLGLKEPYRGSIPIISGELAEDFTYYFARSEQTPSAVALGVLVDRDLSVRSAGGFLIQMLPGVPDEEISHIEQKLSQLPPLTSLIDQNVPLEEILNGIIGPIRVLSESPVVFRCRCSREKVQSTLLSLGKEEIRSILEEEGQAEVVCHFCNEKYVFGSEDLKDILKQAR